jgi:hypothetical protein
MRLEPGQRVRLRREGSEDEWCEGTVLLASNTNPSSLFVALEGGVRAKEGIILYGLPLVIDYQKETIESLLGDSYEMDVAITSPTFDPRQERQPHEGA